LLWFVLILLKNMVSTDKVAWRELLHPENR
jgi:hypothetical protein